MRTRSEWFLGCGGSLELNSEINLRTSNKEKNATSSDSRGKYSTSNLCGDHNINNSGSLRPGICSC